MVIFLKNFIRSFIYLFIFRTCKPPRGTDTAADGDGRLARGSFAGKEKYRSDQRGGPSSPLDSGVLSL